MWKAGVWALALLLLSRMLGLARESALAASFGLTGLADVAVLMLAIPDWLAGVAVGGALSYVLLPLWASLGAAQRTHVQRRVAVWLLVGGVVVACGVFAGRAWLAPQLVRGVTGDGLLAATEGLGWAAWGIPAALLAALWVTRLQFEGDAVGMYAASLVVNGVVIAGLWGGVSRASGAHDAVMLLGVVLLAALLLRLVWQAWRLRRCGREALHADGEQSAQAVVWPAASAWWWAALAAGLPLLLPFVARTLASGAGEGALAQFNYAWKLVELPLMLAVQLVAVLAFGGIARALAGEGADEALARERVRSSLALAWVLACGAVLVLVMGGDGLARLLFGWGRMDAHAVAQVAHWGRWGAWGLLPQALVAVLATVLATRMRLKPLALAYGAGLLLVLLAPRVMGDLDGVGLMNLLNAALAVVAIVAVWEVGEMSWMPWRLMAGTAAALAVLLGAWSALAVMVSNPVIALVGSSLLACVFVAASGWLSADVRRALRR